jgi:glycosyltransferase involved in cell wall biosynthesis
MSIRFLAITDPGCAASTRYRVAQYQPYLKPFGSELRIQPWPRIEADRPGLLEAVAEADVVLIQRYLPPRGWLHRIRRRARRLVYDYDDAILYWESTRRRPRLMWDRWWRFREMMRCCDAVTAGNTYLAGLARRHANPRCVCVVPTTLEWERYEHEPARTEAGPVLGWIGGHWTLPYLERLRRPLEQLSAQVDGLVVRAIADQAPDLGRTRVEPVPWAADTELRELKRLRIGLAPLPDDSWTRGKCGLRLLQYLAAGVPAVAAPVGTQEEVIRAGAALGATSESDWIQTIQRVLADGSLAADLATRGRQLVRERFSVRSWAPRVFDCWRGGP